MREVLDKSYIKQKFKFLSMSKPSKKTIEMQNQFMEWMSRIYLNTMYDFEEQIICKYQVSKDKKYFYINTNNNSIYFEKTEEQYGQICYILVSSEVSYE